MIRNGATLSNHFNIFWKSKKVRLKKWNRKKRESSIFCYCVTWHGVGCGGQLAFHPLMRCSVWEIWNTWAQYWDLATATSSFMTGWDWETSGVTTWIIAVNLGKGLIPRRSKNTSKLNRKTFKSARWELEKKKDPLTLFSIKPKFHVNFVLHGAS